MYTGSELRHKLQQAKEYFRASQPAMCLCPPALKAGCSSGIVEAHTLPRSGVLKAIAENDQVYTVMTTFDRRIRDREAEPYGVQLMSTKNASTIPAFCGAHDKSLFQCIEDRFIQPTPEQVLAMHFRAVSREYYQKITHVPAVEFTRKHHDALNPNDRILLDYSYQMLKNSVELGLEDVKSEKDRLDSLLAANDPAKLHYVCLWLDGSPVVATSGAAMPECDFTGNPLQDLSDARHAGEFVALTWIPNTGGTLAVMSWLDGSTHVGSRFAESLQALPAAHKPDAILNFAFSYFENTYMRPSWWDRLSNAERSKVLVLMKSGVEEMQRDPRVLETGDRPLIVQTVTKETRV